MSSQQRTRSPSPAPRRLGDTLFRYEELDPQQNEIRLLRILPGSTHQPIECEVLHTPLHDRSQYTAISYAWGDAEDTCDIKLNGFEFPVTRSLWGALRRLRSETSAAVVWADAICINQQNTTERSAQVRMMTSIYKSAANMALWLGEEADGSNEAFDLIDNVLRNPEMIEQMIASPAHRHQFEAVVELFEREYWYRLWCVQEVFNGKNIMVYCGFRAVDWESLKSFQTLMEPYPVLLLETWGSRVSSNSRTWPLVICQHGPGCMWTAEEPSDILRLLLLCHRKSCSEPRDKVYGILGLLEPHEQSLFPVDYKISVREVFTNVVEHILTKTHSLDIIREHSNSLSRVDTFSLPSWIPNFASIGSVRALGGVNSGIFSAAANIKATFSFSHRRSRLNVSGMVLDRINKRGMRIETYTASDSILMAFHQWRFILIEHFGYNVSKHEAFCRVLRLNRSQTWSPRTPHQWLILMYSAIARFTKKRVPAMLADPHLAIFEDALTASSWEEIEALFLTLLHDNLQGRRFMISETGLLCLGTGHGYNRDLICVLLGSSTPVILRECKGYYTYVGDVFVDGYMYGKAIEELNGGARQLQTFELR